MPNINTTITLPVETQTFYDRTLLKRMLPYLVFMRFAQKKSIPKKSGKKINFRRYTPLPPATTPLTEGVTPEGETLNVDQVEAVVKFYGRHIENSDELDLVGIDDSLTESSELLGEQAGLTLDTLTRNEVCSGTNVQYAGGVTGTSNVTAKISSEEVKKAVRTLKKANAPTIDGSYIGVIDPDISYDIQNDPLWMDVSKYSGGKAIMDGEIGKLGGVRFIETTNTLVKEGKIHYAMIIGKDAYGAVDIANKNSGEKPRIILKTFESGGTSDPLEQRQTVGWKAPHVAVRLNELAMVRLEVAVSE